MKASDLLAFAVIVADITVFATPTNLCCVPCEQDFGDLIGVNITHGTHVISGRDDCPTMTVHCELGGLLGYQDFNSASKGMAVSCGLGHPISVIFDKPVNYFGFEFEVQYIDDTKDGDVGVIYANGAMSPSNSSKLNRNGVMDQSLEYYDADTSLSNALFSIVDNTYTAPRAMAKPIMDNVRYCVCPLPTSPPSPSPSQNPTVSTSPSISPSLYPSTTVHPSVTPEKVKGKGKGKGKGGGKKKNVAQAPDAKDEKQYDIEKYAKIAEVLFDLGMTEDKVEKVLFDLDD